MHWPQTGMDARMYKTAVYWPGQSQHQTDPSRSHYCPENPNKKKKTLKSKLKEINKNKILKVTFKTKCRTSNQTIKRDMTFEA
jgi:hypothetical protein